MDVIFLFTVGQSIILIPEEIIPIVAIEPSVAPVITMLHLHQGSNFIATYLAHSKSEAVSATLEPSLRHEVASIVADKRAAQQYVVNSFAVQFHEHLLGPIVSIMQVNYLSVLVAMTGVQGYTALILALLSSMIHSEGATSLIYPECTICPTFMLLVKTEFATTALQPCIAYVAIRTLVAAVGGELIHPSRPYLLLSLVLSKWQKSLNVDRVSGLPASSCAAEGLLVQLVPSVDETLIMLNVNNFAVVFTWVIEEEDSGNINGNGQYGYHILYMLLRLLEVELSVISVPTVYPHIASYNLRCTESLRIVDKTALLSFDWHYALGKFNRAVITNGVICFGFSVWDTNGSSSGSQYFLIMRLEELACIFAQAMFQPLLTTVVPTLRNQIAVFDPFLTKTIAYLLAFTSTLSSQFCAQVLWSSTTVSLSCGTKASTVSSEKVHEVQSSFVHACKLRLSIAAEYIRCFDPGIMLLYVFLAYIVGVGSEVTQHGSINEVHSTNYCSLDYTVYTFQGYDALNEQTTLPLKGVVEISLSCLLLHLYSLQIGCAKRETLVSQLINHTVPSIAYLPVWMRQNLWWLEFFYSAALGSLSSMCTELAWYFSSLGYSLSSLLIASMCYTVASTALKLCSSDSPSVNASIHDVEGFPATVAVVVHPSANPSCQYCSTASQIIKLYILLGGML